MLCDINYYRALAVHAVTKPKTTDVTKILFQSRDLRAETEGEERL